KPLAIDPSTIHYAVLTHAHLDHTGWLPRLAKAGYSGPIYADQATIELTEILLKDSAHLQQEDSQRAARHKNNHRQNDEEPLYGPEDVDPVMRRMKPVPRKGGFDISPEFHVETCDAGHILGSTSLILTITEGG